MICKQCNLIEMLVMARNKKEVVYQCPKCESIATFPIEEEQDSFKMQEENI